MGLACIIHVRSAGGTGSLAEYDIVFGYVGVVVLGVGTSWGRAMDCRDVPLAYDDP